MNVLIGFSPSHYFPPTDGKVAVKLAGWLLSRLEAAQVVLSTTNTLLALCLLSQSKSLLPLSGEK